MKNKVVLLIIAMLLITSCTFKPSDAVRFKNEYESLNNKEDNNGNTYQKVIIDENNPIIYSDAREILTMIEDKKTFIVLFGYNTSFWSRALIPTLLKVANDEDLDTMYYVDINEIRDVLDTDGSTIQKGTQEYFELLKAFDEVLNDYTFAALDGTIVNFEEKRIDAPSVIAVIDGKAQMMRTGITEDITDYFVTDEILASAYSSYSEVIRLVVSKNAVCTQDAGC